MVSNTTILNQQFKHIMKLSFPNLYKYLESYIVHNILILNL